MEKREIGIVGLGTMGRNLALNLSEHGYGVAGFARDPQKVLALRQEGAGLAVDAFGSLAEMVAHLREPRAVLLLVTAGAAVDEVIEQLRPLLAPGDLIIDAGNSHFRDGERRFQHLEQHGLRFLTTGVSGGESGARHGPSIMPSGTPEAYERVRPLFEAIAARAGGEPCVAYLGPRAAGHFVKMVHNGIEYGIMQLIAETYDVLRRGLGLDYPRLSEVYASWNVGHNDSYLLAITAEVLGRLDEYTGRPLVEMILDEAKQKGTGAWTSHEALELQVPMPTVDVAVTMRNFSGLKAERVAASRLLRGPEPRFRGDEEAFLVRMRNALYAATICTYAQGLALLTAASTVHDYQIDLGQVARIWRGGCIVRAALLDRIRSAYGRRADLPNLLLDEEIASEVMEYQSDLRAVVATAAELGIPAPALSVTLAYFDAYRSEVLPANLIQAQRDYFGAHTYRRTDREGTFHTKWEVE